MRKSAEARAIERLASSNNVSDWELVANPGDPVDIAKVRERLKKRGYYGTYSQKDGDRTL